MPNSVPNPQLMPNILGAALDVLRQEAALATLVNKNFAGSAGSIGQVVNIAKAATLPVSNVTPAAVPPNLQDVAFGYTQITINQWKKAIFYMNEQDATFYQTGVLIPLQIREAVRALAYQLNADIISTHTSIYGQAGTAGTNPFSVAVNPVADAKKILDDQLCPFNNRYMALGHVEVAAALKLVDLKYMLNAGDSGALRKGAVGSLYGFNTFSDIQIPTFTAGTDNQAYVTNGVQAAGISAITVVTGAGTMIVGDLLVITTGGVAYQYVVTSALAAGSVGINPPLLVASGASDTVKVTGASTTYRRNLAFDPSAFGLVMRVPPTSIEGAPTLGQSMSMTDAATGMSLKLSHFPGYHANQWELSMMYGIALIDPKKACILLG